MAFKTYERPAAQGRRSLAPTVAIAATQLYFNRNAIKMIGEENSIVILSFDEDTSTIGFWFFKDPQDKRVLERPRAAHTITHVPIRGSGKVSCLGFIKLWDLYKLRKQTGKTSFHLERQKDMKTGPDFYTAQIA